MSKQQHIFHHTYYYLIPDPTLKERANGHGLKLINSSEYYKNNGLGMPGMEYVFMKGINTKPFYSGLKPNLNLVFKVWPSLYQ